MNWIGLAGNFCAAAGPAPSAQAASVTETPTANRTNCTGMLLSSCCAEHGLPHMRLAHRLAPSLENLHGMFRAARAGGAPALYTIGGPRCAAPVGYAAPGAVYAKLCAPAQLRVVEDM